MLAVFVITPSRSSRTASYRSRVIASLLSSCGIDRTPFYQRHKRTSLNEPATLYPAARWSPGTSSGDFANEPSAADKPFESFVFIMITEMFDLRFHEMTGNARYYPKKSAI